LPFGLEDFTALADAHERCVVKEYIYHYLHDFIVLGPPDSEACIYY